MIKYIILFLFPLYCSSQVKITGNIKNDLGENIYGVSVVINNIETNDIISYDITNENGNFEINLNTLVKQFYINTRILGYKNENILIENISQTINLILKTELTELKEIVVKSPPITKKGDTLSYNVASFANDKDRTIADVLSKMPGIDVLSDGKILYQGKPINKYYIEGLDLLEGKYNLANKNLPFNQVSKVQILENHQPIKVLDSLVYSDNAALNIKLKNNVSFTGQAELGTGFSPFLWENNITPMLFSKNNQMITSYQSNNTGNDVGTQLKTLTIEDLIENFDTNTEKKDWLAIQQLRTPSFSEKRWLDNNIHLLTSNYLQKFKNDLELRLNISFLNDFQQQNGFTKTLLFTQNDTIKIDENKYNRLFKNSLQTNLTLQKNTKKNYLKNSFQYQGFWDSQNGLINRGMDIITQNLENHYFNFSNKFKNIFSIGKQLVTLNSFISFNKTPQNLSITPGQFEVLLNENNTYNNLTQQLHLKSFATNNSIGFTKSINQFTITPKIGFQVENQKLNSQLFVDNNLLENEEFYNQLNWYKNKSYIEFQTQFKRNKWRFELNTPLNFYNFNIKDVHLEKKEVINRFTFEPRFSVINDITTFWKFSTSLGIKNQFGTIDDIHYAYILKNYRNIQRINSVIPQSISQNYNSGISYRNPIKSLFGNIFYSFTTSSHNLLYSSRIIENGSVELQAIEQDNIKENHTISGRLSKSISSIKTNFTFNTSLSILNFFQILNNNLTKIQNQNNNFSLKSNTDITDWLDIEYQTSWNFSKSKVQNQNNTPITNQSHILNLNLYPKKNHYFGLKSEYLKNDLFSKNNTNYFADLIYRYTYKKKNIDFELQYNNIFNTKNFQTISIDNYSYIETNFALRPSQLLFKIRMSL